MSEVISMKLLAFSRTDRGFDPNAVQGALNLRTGLAIALLFMSSALSALPFTFEGGKEGLLELPSGKPRALVLYFHRGIEDRSAVLVWAKILGPAGFAVAGYTNDNTMDVVNEARSALAVLRQRKEIAGIPVIVMGASMGTYTASGLFSADTAVRGVVLIVPPSMEVCEPLRKAAGRRVLIVEAARDEIARMHSREILGCAPKNADYVLLPDASHRFSPAVPAPEIIKWLNSVLQR